MLKRPHYIVLGLVILLALVVLNLPSRAATRLKLALGGLFLPLFGLAGSTQQLSEKAINLAVPRRHLLQELDQLRKDNQRLRLRSVQADETLRENGQLRQLLGWQKQAPWKMKLARVIGRDPANWWRSLHINLGERDGLRADLPVLNPEGLLVGRVSAVGQARSQVVLVGDANCRVSVLVQETRDHGMIAPGSGNPLDSSLVDLTYLSQGSLLKPGQHVVTSEWSAIYPKGIVVGQIVDFRTVGYGLAIEARVKLAANLSTLEEVWVILP